MYKPLSAVDRSAKKKNGKKKLVRGNQTVTEIQLILVVSNLHTSTQT